MKVWKLDQDKSNRNWDKHLQPNWRLNKDQSFSHSSSPSRVSSAPCIGKIFRVTANSIKSLTHIAKQSKRKKGVNYFPEKPLVSRTSPLFVFFKKTEDSIIVSLSSDSTDRRSIPPAWESKTVSFLSSALALILYARSLRSPNLAAGAGLYLAGGEWVDCFMNQHR